MNANRFFWGLIILMLGIFWLLSNFGVLPSNFWFEIWKLWPLLLIFWGVSLLFNKEKRGGLVISIIIVALFACIIVLFGWLYNSGKTYTSTSTPVSEIILENASNGDINFKFGAAELTINGVSDKLIEGETETIAEIEVKSSSGGTNQKVTIEQSANVPFNWGVNNGKNEMNFKLTDKIPLSVNLDTGASKFDLDLSKNKVSGLTINCGASEGDIKIGSLMDIVNIVISSGASNFNLKVPTDFALKIVNKSGLSGNNFGNLGLQKDGEIWKSEGFETATKKIDLTFSSGVSNLNIERY